MAAFELRDYIAALRNLTAALQNTRKPLSAEQRRQVQDLLDRSRLFVGVYTLTVSPRSARVIVDGRVPEFEPDGTLLFGFGTHTLEVSAPGMVAKSLAIDVRGGERKNLSVTLPPQQAPPVSTRSNEQETEPVDATAKTSAAEPSHGNAAAWLWASGGAALLAGGAAALLIEENSQLNSCHHPTDTNMRCTNESAIKAMWGTSLGLTIAAGAAAVTMAIVGILSWDSGAATSRQSHSALNCAVSPFGVACAARF